MSGFSSIPTAIAWPWSRYAVITWSSLPMSEQQPTATASWPM